MSYTVEEHEHGIVVKGPVPISDLLALLKVWKRERGLNWCDAVVAQALGASFVVCAKRDSDLWRKKLGVYEKGLGAKGVKLSIG